MLERKGREMTERKASAGGIERLSRLCCFCRNDVTRGKKECKERKLSSLVFFNVCFIFFKKDNSMTRRGRNQENEMRKENLMERENVNSMVRQ